MKKKISVLMICVLLIVGSTCLAHGSEIMPLYTAITSVDTTILLDDGNITFSVFVVVDSATTLDSAYVDVVLRSTGGTVVATYSGRKMTYSYGSFYYANESEVTATGTYLITYEVRCYKDGVLVDNPTGSSNRVTYTA